MMENFENQGRSKRQTESNEKVMVAGCAGLLVVFIITVIFELLF